MFVRNFHCLARLVSLCEQKEIIEHCQDAHSVNIHKMQVERTIPVDPNAAKNPLVLDQCLDYEAKSEAKKEVMLTAWWTKCVGQGIFSQNTGRENSNLDANVNDKFMKAMKVAVGNDFFEKFEMHLKVVLDGTDFDHSFSCKWSRIEEAFSRAQGADGQAKCLSAYLIEEDSMLGGKSIESTLNSIESAVNNTFNNKDR